MKQRNILFIFLFIGIVFTSCSGTKCYSGIRKFEKRAFNPKRKLTDQQKLEQAEIERRQKSQIRTKEEIEAKNRFDGGLQYNISYLKVVN